MYILSHDDSLVCVTPNLARMPNSKNNPIQVAFSPAMCHRASLQVSAIRDFNIPTSVKLESKICPAVRLLAEGPQVQW
jgi:hypothetical protein